MTHITLHTDAGMLKLPDTPITITLLASRWLDIVHLIDTLKDGDIYDPTYLEDVFDDLLKPLLEISEPLGDEVP